MTRRIARSPRCARSLPRTTDWKASSQCRAKQANPTVPQSAASSAARMASRTAGAGRRRVVREASGGRPRSARQAARFAPRFRASNSRLVSRLVSRLSFAAGFAAQVRGSFRGSFPRSPHAAAVSQSRAGRHLSCLLSLQKASAVSKGGGWGGGWGRPRSARRASRRRPARPCRRSPAPRLSLPARSGMRRGHARRKPSELHYKTLLGEFEFKLS